MRDFCASLLIILFFSFPKIAPAHKLPSFYFHKSKWRLELTRPRSRKGGQATSEKYQEKEDENKQYIQGMLQV